MGPTKDNATLGVNPNFPMTLLCIATKDIDADPTNVLPIYLPYCGKYWCDDQYPIELQVQAIRRYHINNGGYGWRLDSTSKLPSAIPTFSTILLRHIC